MLTLDCFKAGKGDSLLLGWGPKKDHLLLIDAGVEGTYRFIRSRLNCEKKLEAILITHIDYDHIGGFFKLLADPDFQAGNLKVYMNTPSLVLAPQTSGLVAIDHGVEFEQMLHKKGLVATPLYLGKTADNRETLNGLELQILSPAPDVIAELIKQWTASAIYQQYQSQKNPKNNKVSASKRILKPAADILSTPPKPHAWKDDLLNASSIAFIARYQGRQLLLLGDASPALLADELVRLGYSKNRKLEADLVKISHHGSKHNTTRELLEKISCNSYLISTDSTGPYYHPARETLILIAAYGRPDKSISLKIYSNYGLNLKTLLTPEEQKDLNIEFQEIAYLEFPDK